MKQAQSALAAAQEEHQSEVRQFAGRRERIDAQQLRLEQELEELEAHREETRGQRRRIAQQLRGERTALTQERESLETELERQRKAYQKTVERNQLQLAKDRESLEQEMNRARQQLERDRQQFEQDTAALAAARQQLEDTRRATAKDQVDQSADLLAAQQEIQRLTAELSDAQRIASEAVAKLTPLQQAYDALKLEVTHGTESSAEEAHSARRVRFVEDSHRRTGTATCRRHAAIGRSRG